MYAEQRDTLRSLLDSATITDLKSVLDQLDVNTLERVRVATKAVLTRIDEDNQKAEQDKIRDSILRLLGLPVSGYALIDLYVNAPVFTHKFKAQAMIFHNAIFGYGGRGLVCLVIYFKGADIWVGMGLVKDPEVDCLEILGVTIGCESQALCYLLGRSHLPDRVRKYLLTALGMLS